jgi:membrane dipeptidase
MRYRIAVLALALSALASSALAQNSKPTTAKDWKQIHQSAIVVDTHADTTGRFIDENFDPSNDAGKGHWDIEKAHAGNLGAEFFSIWVDPEKYKGQYAHRTLAMIDAVNDTVAKHPNDMVMAYSTQDILAARRGPHKRIAALMGIEGGHSIENDVHLLRDYYRLGVRYMTLTWANSNEWAESAGGFGPWTTKAWKDDKGLSEEGRQIVREMNRLGMMVDISHVSDRSFFNALTASRAPVIASHSGARAVADHPRNLTDDMLVALARNGGVAQVNFFCGFISNDYIQASKKFQQEHPEEFKRYRELSHQFESTHDPAIEKQLDAMQAQMSAAIPRTPLSVLIDHIDHIAKVAGVDHVGLGSDFDGVTCLPQGIDSVADLPKITQALSERGYKEADLQKILGGNLLRVFAEVEKISKQMQTTRNADTRQEVKVPEKK